MFSGSGIIIIRIFKTACHRCPMRECRSYFSFSCYGSLFYLHQSPATYSLQTNISSRSSPLITCIDVPDILCPYILIFISQPAVTDLPKSTLQKGNFQADWRTHKKNANSWRCLPQHLKQWLRISIVITSKNLVATVKCSWAEQSISGYRCQSKIFFISIYLCNYQPVYWRAPVFLLRLSGRFWTHYVKLYIMSEILFLP